MSESGFFSDGEIPKKRSGEFEKLAESLREIRKQLRNCRSFSKEDVQTLERLSKRIEEIGARIESLERGIGELEARLTGRS